MPGDRCVLTNRKSSGISHIDARVILIVFINTKTMSAKDAVLNCVIRQSMHNVEIHL